jgi:NADPH:quinone reductase-like Zn-dependent oxidoreductase
MAQNDAPDTMTAVRIHEAGSPAGVSLDTVPTPTPGRGEVLVRVPAAAVTRDELTWPEANLPAVPAHEFSGEVVGTGDAVYALGEFDHDGAAADYVVVAEALLAPKPASLSHAQAATIPLAALSAWQALFVHGGLGSGQRVLVHGASGAVGGYAVQLAHHAGAHVIAVVSTAGIATATEHGAEQVIDRTTTRFEDAVDPVDLVIDTVGGDVLTRSRAVLGAGGCLVTISSEPAADWAGDSGATATFFIVEPNREQLVQITALVDSGVLKPSAVEPFPLTDARAAFEKSLDRDNRGKVVFTVLDES